MERQASSAPAPNILIVDDTPANLQLLAGMLKERGYKPRDSSSGERAIEAARLMCAGLDLAGCQHAGHGRLRSLRTPEGRS